MANQANQAAVSAVASASAEMFNGRLWSDVEATVSAIGFDMQKTEAVIGQATDVLQQRDAQLLPWICVCDDDSKPVRDPETKKLIPVPYDDFMRIRAVFVKAAYDAGAESMEEDSAGAVWRRSINRLISNAGFVRPRAEGKDAKRMSEKAEKRRAELAKMTELELEAQRTELIEKGDSKSLRVAGELAKELEARAKPEIDKVKAEAKQLADALTKRIRELAKAGTPDSVEILIRMVQASK